MENKFLFFLTTTLILSPKAEHGHFLQISIPISLESNFNSYFNRLWMREEKRQFTPSFESFVQLEMESNKFL